jgi:Flp pilus assembly protein TadG
MQTTAMRSRGSDERGAVLVEFALSLPLLVLLIVGIFDFGFLFQEYQVVTNAAREGARMAVLTGYSDTDVQNRVAAYLDAGGVTGSPTTTVADDVITPPSGTPFTTKVVTVTLPHTFTYLGPIATLFGATFGTVTLTASAEMRAEVAAGGT